MFSVREKILTNLALDSVVSQLSGNVDRVGKGVRGFKLVTGEAMGELQKSIKRMEEKVKKPVSFTSVAGAPAPK